MLVNYHKIIEDIEKLIKGDISTSTKDLKRVSTDASLFTIKPQFVIYPLDKFDIQAVVRYVKKIKEAEPEKYKTLSITVRAAGTDMSGGPLNDSIIMDVTKYMQNFDKVEGNTIESEPGVYFRDLEKYLDTKELMYPSYPASKDLCCVGGIVANNSAGEKSLLYGQTKDWIEEIEMVLEDGTIHNFKKIGFKEMEESELGVYHQIFNLIETNLQEILKNKPITTKNSSGYNIWDVVDYENKTVDMCKLICGSQGTLGIITKVKLRLVAKKKYSQMLTVLMPNLDKMVELVEEVLKYKPEAIETYDDHTIKIVMKFLPTIIWRLKGSIWQLAKSFLPEAWMAFTGGIPKLILMAEFTGQTQAEANKKANTALTHVQKFKYKSRVTKSELELQKYWLFRRESFNLLRSKLKGFRTAPFVEDVIVPIESMKEFIPEMQDILDAEKYIYTIAGHAGNGNFHIIPLMKLDSKNEIEQIRRTNQEVFSLVQKYHGSLAAEHNDGLVRTPYLHFMFTDEMLELFKQVKNTFDANNTFNPNKKVGGSVTENYSKIALTKN